MVNFIVHGGEMGPEMSREELILLQKEAFEEIKNGIAGNRQGYIMGLLGSIKSGKITEEELDLNSDDIKYLEDELVKIQERQKLVQQIGFLKKDIEIEKRKIKFRRDKKILKEKALEIKKIIDEEGLTYEECKVDPLMISELTK